MKIEYPEEKNGFKNKEHFFNVNKKRNSTFPL